MSASAIITVSPQDDAGAVLLARIGRMRRVMRTFYSEVGEVMSASTQERWEREEAPSGEPWAPLSPATLEARNRRYGGKRTKRGKGGTTVETAGFARYRASQKILQVLGMRGGLRRSISYDAQADGLTIGTTRVYGAVHQFGLGPRSSVRSRRRFAGIPARPFIGISADDGGAIAQLVQRYIAEGE